MGWKTICVVHELRKLCGRLKTIEAHVVLRENELREICNSLFSIRYSFCKCVNFLSDENVLLGQP